MTLTLLLALTRENGESMTRTLRSAVNAGTNTSLLGLSAVLKPLGEEIMNQDQEDEVKAILYGSLAVLIIAYILIILVI